MSLDFKEEAAALRASVQPKLEKLKDSISKELFWSSVEEASKRVAAWPEWKRNYRLTKYSKGITMSVAIMYRPLNPKAESHLSSRSNLREILVKTFGEFPIELNKTEIGILLGIANCGNEEIYELIDAIRAKGTMVLETEA